MPPTFHVDRLASRKLRDRLFVWTMNSVTDALVEAFVNVSPFSVQQHLINYQVVRAVALGYREGARSGRRARPPDSERRRVKIAILGTRGVPAAYGGFETLAWELSTRLAARGHEVTVYCRRGRTDETIAVPPGVRRRFLPYLPGKYLETVSHAGLSALDSVLHGYDAIWLGNAANAIFAGLPRVRGTAVALNVDGIERQRAKWGFAGRRVVQPRRTVRPRLSERHRLGRRGHPGLLPGAVRQAVGADRLRRAAAGPRPAARPGAPGPVGRRARPLLPLRQSPGAREPGRLVISAYRDVPGDLPLLIVGDAPYAEGFKAHLRGLAANDRRVRLTGAIYGEGYRDLQRGALAYIQATSVGGTHPALVEAMGAGNLVLAFATPENVEVTAGTGLLFADAAQLTGHLRRIAADPAAPELAGLRAAARARAEATYSWDAVTTAYEELFTRLTRR